jgi:hypothetical protein
MSGVICDCFSSMLFISTDSVIRFTPVVVFSHFREAKVLYSGEAVIDSGVEPSENQVNSYAHSGAACGANFCVPSAEDITSRHHTLLQGIAFDLGWL